MEKNKLSMPLAIILGAIIIGLGLYFGLSSNGTPGSVGTTELKSEDVSKAINITPLDTEVATEITESDWIVGDLSQAELVLLEYSDLECPFCKRFNDDLVKNLKTQYQDESKVAFAFRHFPLGVPLTNNYDLHPTAPEEAVILECVGLLTDEKTFFDFKEEIFATTGSDGKYDLALLLQQAEGFGVKKSKLTECYEGSEAAGRVAYQYRQGEMMGVSGTPSAFLQLPNKELMPLPLELSGAIAPIIDKVLAGGDYSELQTKIEAFVEGEKQVRYGDMTEEELEKIAEELNNVLVKFLE